MPTTPVPSSSFEVPVAVAVAGPKESPKVISGNHADRKPGLLDAATVLDRQARRDRLDEEVEPVHARSPGAGSVAGKAGDARPANRRASGAPGAKIRSGICENGTPPSSVTSQVSCM